MRRAVESTVGMDLLLLSLCPTEMRSERMRRLAGDAQRDRSPMVRPW